MSDRFQLKALITGVDRLSPVLGGIRRNANNLRRQLTESGLGKIGFMEALQGGALALPFILGAKEAMRFESAMADVKKVVNFDSPEQFKQMSKDVLGLSEQLPMAANGIAQIVAAGGHHGRHCVAAAVQRLHGHGGANHQQGFNAGRCQSVRPTASLNRRGKPWPTWNNCSRG